MKKDDKTLIKVQKNDHYNLTEDCLIRELDYCYFTGNITDNLRDQFVLFGGTTAKNLNDFLGEPYENFDINDPFERRPPGLDIVLEYVYGFQVLIKLKIKKITFFSLLIKENHYIMFMFILYKILQKMIKT